ncbi:MAG TPA: hypothetical protein VJA18_05225 [Candidatus Nanoarchaeia archaeon]|nr:hypothetical protein [Candidatus Nanoarchaeia archaeon]
MSITLPVKPFLSDEEIYSGLEIMLDYFCEQIPRYRPRSGEAFEEARWDLERRPLFQEHFRKLQDIGYDEYTARDFLFAGYTRLLQIEAIRRMENEGYNQLTAEAFYGVCRRYLVDRRALDDDQLRISTDIIPFGALPPDTKTDWCMQMFEQNEKYIKVNYDRSLRIPEKPAVKSLPPRPSPFDKPPRLYFGGK